MSPIIWGPSRHLPFKDMLNIINIHTYKGYTFEYINPAPVGGMEAILRRLKIMRRKSKYKKMMGAIKAKPIKQKKRRM